jgi:hypothetical protein
MTHPDRAAIEREFERWKKSGYSQTIALGGVTLAHVPERRIAFEAGYRLALASSNTLSGGELDTLVNRLFDLSPANSAYVTLSLDALRKTRRLEELKGAQPIGEEREDGRE